MINSHNSNARSFLVLNWNYDWWQISNDYLTGDAISWFHVESFSFFTRNTTIPRTDFFCSPSPQPSLRLEVTNLVVEEMKPSLELLNSSSDDVISLNSGLHSTSRRISQTANVRECVLCHKWCIHLFGCSTDGMQSISHYVESLFLNKIDLA